MDYLRYVVRLQLTSILMGEDWDRWGELEFAIWRCARLWSMSYAVFRRIISLRSRLAGRVTLFDLSGSRLGPQALLQRFRWGGNRRCKASTS